MKLLICTMGSSRSGKSTWVREFSKKTGIPVVCPEDIRVALHGSLVDWGREKEVWQIAQVMVKCLFNQYNYVIFDATNYRRKNRKTPKKWARKLGADINFKVFHTSKEECLKRAQDTPELLPVIERHFNLYEPLDSDEVEFDDKFLTLSNLMV